MTNMNMKALFVGGRYHKQEMTVEEIISNGIWNGSLSEDLSEARKHGAWVHRAELDNQPLVDGYLSPMWDGGKLRYETAEVYDIMSR